MTRYLDTSRSAYHSVIPKLNEKQAAVLAVLEASTVPLNDREIADKLGWTINRVTPRRGELCDMGKVVDAGKRKGASGRDAYQWVAGNAAPPAPRMKQVIVEVEGRRMMRWVPDDN